MLLVIGFGSAKVGGEADRSSRSCIVGDEAVELGSEAAMSGGVVMVDVVDVCELDDKRRRCLDPAGWVAGVHVLLKNVPLIA